MGIGSARGEHRAVEAARNAISSPLLESSIEGARGVLLNISGGSDLGLFEVHEAADIVASAVHPDANIIFGAVVDDQLGDEVRVTVVACGFDWSMPEEQPAAPLEMDAAGEEDWSAESPDVFDNDAGEEDLDIPSFLRRH
jgi:cell division protein FtsZ